MKNIKYGKNKPDRTRSSFFMHTKTSSVTFPKIIKLGGPFEIRSSVYNIVNVRVVTRQTTANAGNQRAITLDSSAFVH